MPTWVCPHCQSRMTVKPVHLGSVSACLSCGESSEVTDADVMAAMLNDEQSSEPVASKEYKVLTQADSWLNNRFDPVGLEKLLNKHARDGWALRGVVGISIPAVVGRTRDELVIILERSSVGGGNG